MGSEKDLRPIAQYLPAHLPKQIYPAGTIPAYSNYATTLAAYRASNRKWRCWRSTLNRGNLNFLPPKKTATTIKDNQEVESAESFHGTLRQA